MIITKGLFGATFNTKCNECANLFTHRKQSRLFIMFSCLYNKLLHGFCVINIRGFACGFIALELAIIFETNISTSPDQLFLKCSVSRYQQRPIRGDLKHRKGCGCIPSCVMRGRFSLERIQFVTSIKRDHFSRIGSVMLGRGFRSHRSGRFADD